MTLIEYGRTDDLIDHRKFTDEALMLAYQGGDYPAFEVLYGRHKSSVYRMVLRQCKHSGVAEELCQEIWLKVIAASEHYVVTAKFLTWLYRIVQNRVIDHLRTGAFQFEQSMEMDEATLDASLAFAAPINDQPERHAERVENAGQLIAAIEALPGPQREAVLLHFEAEMTLEEIAQLTQTTRETVKSRLRYGVRKIREALATGDMTCVSVVPP